MDAVTPIAASANSAATNGTAINDKSLAPMDGQPGGLFGKLIEVANTDQLASQDAIQGFIEQRPGSNIQQVVMAVAEAEMSFQFFMEIRNQLIDSYNELMRMQF